MAEVVAKFVRKFDRQRERCWIAEKDGVNVGCVLLVKKSQTVTQLRLLLVEPRTRGLGIGTRLVHEWRQLPLLDPDLPARLLPRDWPASGAAQLFHRLHDRWAGDAARWWDERGVTVG